MKMSDKMTEVEIIHTVSPQKKTLMGFDIW